MAESRVDKLAGGVGAGKEDVASIAGSGAEVIWDPVCGRTVRNGGPTKKLRFAYAGQTYSFDSRECLDRFAQQPEVFLSHPGEEGKKASFDRARRPENYNHRGATPGHARHARTAAG